MSDAPAYLGMLAAPFQVLAEETRQLAFPLEEYVSRIRRVRELMAEARIDLLYVTTPEHVCYLHGFFASWYKANGPMRYPQVYGTAIHVDSDDFIHFDSPNELPLLT